MIIFLANFFGKELHSIMVLPLKHSLFSIALLLGSLCISTNAESQSATLSQVINSLKGGGYVLFMRHPDTQKDRADTDPLNHSNLLAQRHLTDLGRQQAISIGNSFRTSDIPVGKILSSRFQRAKETGELLNLGEVTTSLELTEGGLIVPPEENERRARVLNKLLSSPPEEGTNLLVISHKPNLQDAAGKEFGDIGEGEVVIFRPNGKGSYKLIARVSDPDLWSVRGR